jgi:hypothetical protein
LERRPRQLSKAGERTCCRGRSASDIDPALSNGPVENPIPVKKFSDSVSRTTQDLRTWGWVHSGVYFKVAYSFGRGQHGISGSASFRRARKIPIGLLSRGSVARKRLRASQAQAGKRIYYDLQFRPLCRGFFGTRLTLPRLCPHAARPSHASRANPKHPGWDRILCRLLIGEAHCRRIPASRKDRT